MTQTKSATAIRQADWVEHYRQKHPAAERWAVGYGQLGSHVNLHRAGGLAEGGYLGFVQLQYMHMPLPGESLITFLSDGAFEEQRGSDWAPRWWRQKDCGDILPIMINNGRRIDQRSTMAQKGGTDWLVRHLRLNSFDPIVIDGTDPAAFVWLIFDGAAAPCRRHSRRGGRRRLSRFPPLWHCRF
ncbi:hypothetical protein IQ241_10725 [Romeria aff. gracilis LEGE 07310]|uniref:Uncharacterized protein n=1 Tax=Vasconcelosia minhoensis LEGE 07310 TaxID=915328 RepID=A0A8J7AVJ5_9CYAN|nr:hypothetical protein [Romeria gracilis]MBE9077763.1 hypothetical protein [Romeria aff. gracilis LEGE 07310]